MEVRQRDVDAPFLLMCSYKKTNRLLPIRFTWWREEDSNLRPLGYEPNELPLLHPAMFSCAKVRTFSLLTKYFGVKKH